MLKKLIKYDLEFAYKGLIIFYILSIFFGILTRIFLSFDNSFLMDIIGKICGGVAISMIFNILINNVMRLLARFNTNFYKDESYLTHTLPVTKIQLYSSKFLTSIITLITSFVIIFITLFIAYYSPEVLNMIKEFLKIVATTYDSTVIGIVIIILLILYLEVLNILQCGYSGLILGHRKENKKIIFSLLYGFVIYIASQLLVLVVIGISSLFSKEMANLLVTTDILSLKAIKTVVIIAILVYTLCIMLGYFINVRLFKKGVNVD